MTVITIYIISLAHTKARGKTFFALQGCGMNVILQGNGKRSSGHPAVGRAPSRAHEKPPGGGWSGSRAPKRFEWRSGLSPRQSGFSENGPLQINLNTDPSGCVFRNNPNQLPLWKRCLFSSGKYWLPREDRLSCHLCLPTAALRVLRACPTFLQPPHRLKQAVKNALSS